MLLISLNIGSLFEPLGSQSVESLMIVVNMDCFRKCSNIYKTPIDQIYKTVLLFIFSS